MISNSLPLITGILKHVAHNRVSFHTPGHKGGQGLASTLVNQSLSSLDLTELPGLDDLHQPSGIIAQAQANCANWLGAETTFFLVNGASVGIQAAFLANLGPNDMVLVPRNAHKSVTAALILTGAKPVYYLPEIHPEFGLPLGFQSSSVINEIGNLPDLKMVFALYPSYYGTVWNLRALRDAWAGLLIVDEAHGAHFTSSDRLPLSSLAFGADLVIHSTHKTMGAFTQGAMLHLGVPNSQLELQVRQALDLLQTTSPSYLIMASLEGAVWDSAVKGKLHWSELAAKAERLKENLNERGIRVLSHNDIGSYGITDVDPTKILVRVANGYKVADELAENFGIQAELWDENNLLFLLGAGDTGATVEYLEDALLRAAMPQAKTLAKQILPELPIQALTPREAFLQEKISIKLTDAVGMVCAETLASYPPGIPVIVPGEIVNRDVVEYIDQAKRAGAHWQGNSDPALNYIKVVKEKGNGRFTDNF